MMKPQIDKRHKILRLREVAERQGVSSWEMCKRVVYDLARTKGIQVVRGGKTYRLVELCHVSGRICKDLKDAFKVMKWKILVGKDGTVYRLVPETEYQNKKIVRKILK